MLLHNSKIQYKTGVVIIKNMIIKSIFRISLLFTVILTSIWIIIARPVYTPQTLHDVEALVNTAALQQHVIFLTETTVPRNSENPENLALAADYIKQQFKQSTARVNFQTYPDQGREYKNIIAHYGPETDERIVIGAHYDAYANLPGADDNASGVAGLLELGKLLSALPLKNQVTLVAYTLEEPPYFASDKMGSYVHAAMLQQQNVKIKIMIALEMIGYFSDEPGSQVYPIPMLNLFYPDAGNFIAVIDRLQSNKAAAIKAAINTYTDLSAYSINAPDYVPGIALSDHSNYWLFDYPAVMVTDTALYRNQAYHTPQDTHDRLNYKNMAKVIYGIFQYIKTIAS